LISYRAGEARCAGTVQAPLLAEQPLPTSTYVPRNSASKMEPVRLRFRIDGSGRTSNIKSVTGAPTTFYVSHSDVQAAFAAWRFRAGGARSDCEIEFALEAAPIESADLKSIYRYLVFQGPRSPGGNAVIARAAFERSKPPGDCFTGDGPNVRTRAYPAFEKIPQAQGTLSHSMIGFDVDAGGKPSNVRLLDSGGNVELDRQSLDAVSRSSFAPGARTGCTYPYYRRQSDPLKAPEAPPASSFRSEESNCPAELGQWAYIPAFTFPPDFNRRAIEGWAAIRYDLAPWGATGNLSVLAAEPAEAFGAQAMRIVSQARRAPSSGYSGCVTLVRFVLAPSGASPAAGEASDNQ
jgi:TonB family protein